MKIKIPKPVKKQELTEEKKKAILRDVQFIGVLSQLIENRWRNNLFDANLNNSILRNFNRQIIFGALGLKKNLWSKYKLKDVEELEFEMSPAMDRVVSFFSMLPTDSVDLIMDKLEELSEREEMKNE